MLRESNTGRLPPPEWWAMRRVRDFSSNRPQILAWPSQLKPQAVSSGAALLHMGHPSGVFGEPAARHGALHREWVDTTAPISPPNSSPNRHGNRRRKSTVLAHRVYLDTPPLLGNCRETWPLSEATV